MFIHIHIHIHFILFVLVVFLYCLFWSYFRFTGMRDIIVFCCMFLLLCVNGTNDAKSNRISWRDKDIRDMTDADLEHLLDQWEENDEPLEPDELPEHLRPSPKIDISKLDISNPDSVLKMTKRGKGVMMFVDTNADISSEKADIIMRIWQSSLQNNHIITERYPIDPKRSIFLFREGSQAVDAKNFLLQQPELSHITLEGQTFYRDQQKQNANMANINKVVDTVNTKKKLEL